MNEWMNGWSLDTSLSSPNSSFPCPATTQSDQGTMNRLQILSKHFPPIGDVRDVPAVEGFHQESCRSKSGEEEKKQQEEKEDGSRPHSLEAPYYSSRQQPLNKAQVRELAVPHDMQVGKLQVYPLRMIHFYEEPRTYPNVYFQRVSPPLISPPSPLSRRMNVEAEGWEGSEGLRCFPERGIPKIPFPPYHSGPRAFLPQDSSPAFPPPSFARHLPCVDSCIIVLRCRPFPFHILRYSLIIVFFFSVVHSGRAR